jgi:hypothetical protein
MPITMRSKTKYLNAILRWLAVLISVQVQGMSQQAIGAKTFNLPISISIEGSETTSSMYLHIDGRPYKEATLEQFAARKLDEREALFVRGMRAIRQKDYQTFAAIWQAAAENPNATLNIHLDDPKKCVDFYTSLFGKFDNFKVLARFELGSSSSLFLWQANNQTGAMGYAALLVQPNGKRLVVVPVLPSNTLAIITLFAAASWSESGEPLSVQGRNLHYRYVMRLDGQAQPEAHSVSVQFDGVPMNVNIFDESTSPSDKVVAFYQRAYLALKRRSFDEFMAAYLPDSQPGVKSEIALIGDKKYKDYFADITSARYVKFVLNADPVYLIFYSRDPSEHWKPESLRYEYVVRDPSPAGYKLANFQPMGEFDDLLRDPKLFNPAILLPTTAASKTEKNRM